MRDYRADNQAADVAALVRRVGGLTATRAAGILAAYPNGRGLSGATPGALLHLGCTERQAGAIVAAFALARVVSLGASEGGGWRPQCRDPGDVADLLIPWLRGQEQESFCVVHFDARQRVVSVREVARGSLSHVDIHPRELFREAVRLAVHSLVMAHNHPSGSTEPSAADIELTHRMCEVGRLVGVPVLDHLVIAGDQYTSLAAAGLMGGGGM